MPLDFWDFAEEDEKVPEYRPAPPPDDWSADDPLGLAQPGSSAVWDPPDFLDWLGSQSKRIGDFAGQGVSWAGKVAGDLGGIADSVRSRLDAGAALNDTPYGPYLSERALPATTTSREEQAATGEWLPYDVQQPAKPAYEPKPWEALGELPGSEFWQENLGTPLMAGVGDVAETAGSTAEWLGQPGVAEDLKGAATKLHEQYPSELYDFNKFSADSLRDPAFWRGAIVRQIPFQLTILPAAILAGQGGAAFAGLAGLGAVGSAVAEGVAAGVGGRIVESLLEGGQTYADALRKGWDEQQAGDAARNTFLANMPLAAPDMVQYAATFMRLPAGLRQGLAGMLEQRLGRVGTGILRILTSAGTEGAEEGIQAGIQAQAIDEPFEWTSPQTLGAGATGAILGGGMTAAAQGPGIVQGTVDWARENPEQVQRLIRSITPGLGIEDVSAGQPLDQFRATGKERPATGLTKGQEQYLTGKLEDVAPIAPTVEEVAPIEEQPELAGAQFPVAGATVAGLTVLDDVPNMSSIESSLTDYEILPGIRAVPMAAFPGELSKKYFYSADDHTRVDRLMEEIAASGQIKPLIVVVDKEGPYILEGGHRVTALFEMGKTEIPALVVLDTSVLEQPEPSDAQPLSIAAVPEAPAVAPAEGRILAVQPDDVPLQLAIAAHNGTSWVPETRGKQVQADYVQHMQAVEDNLAPLANTPEQREQLKGALERYRQGYLDRLRAYLSAHSRVVSAAIAGPSKFPTRQMEKRSETADLRRNELMEWSTKAQKAMRRDITPEGTGGRAISSSNPEAVRLLEEKLAKARTQQAHMVAANKVVQNKRLSRDDKVQQLVTMGLPESAAQQLLQPDFAGRIGYAAYQLRNNGAEIRRIEARIIDLGREQARAGGEVPFVGGRIVDNEAENRIQIIFDEKPDAAIRAKLKANGFVWAPSHGAWQRLRNENARRALGNLGLDIKASETGPVEAEPQPVSVQRLEEESGEKPGNTSPTTATETTTDDGLTPEQQASVQKVWDRYATGTGALRPDRVVRNKQGQIILELVNDRGHRSFMAILEGGLAGASPDYSQEELTILWQFPTPLPEREPAEVAPPAPAAEEPAKTEPVQTAEEEPTPAPQQREPVVTTQPKPATTQPSPKEPWEMTRGEYQGIGIDARIADVPEAEKAFARSQEQNQNLIYHARQVEQALIAGKPVPQAVIEEYRTLRKSDGAQPAGAKRIVGLADSKAPEVPAPAETVPELAPVEDSAPSAITAPAAPEPPAPIVAPPVSATEAPAVAAFRAELEQQARERIREKLAHDETVTIGNVRSWAKADVPTAKRIRDEEMAAWKAAHPKPAPPAKMPKAPKQPKTVTPVQPTPAPQPQPVVTPPVQPTAQPPIPPATPQATARPAGAPVALTDLTPEQQTTLDLLIQGTTGSMTAWRAPSGTVYIERPTGGAAFSYNTLAPDGTIMGGMPEPTADWSPVQLPPAATPPSGGRPPVVPPNPPPPNPPGPPVNPPGPPTPPGGQPNPPPRGQIVPRFLPTGQILLAIRKNGFLRRFGQHKGQTIGVKQLARMIDPGIVAYGLQEEVALVYRRLNDQAAHIVSVLTVRLQDRWNQASRLGAKIGRDGRFTRGVVIKPLFKGAEVEIEVIDANGQAIKRWEPITLAMGDVAEYAQMYVMTPELRAFFKEQYDITDELVGWAKAEGAEVPQRVFKRKVRLASGRVVEVEGHYFGRLVREVHNIALRSRTRSDLARSHEMMETSLQAGNVYETNMVATAQTVHDFNLRKIVSRRMHNLIVPMSKTMDELLPPSLKKVAEEAKEWLASTKAYTKLLRDIRDGLSIDTVLAAPKAPAGTPRNPLRAVNARQPGTIARLRAADAIADPMARQAAFRGLIKEAGKIITRASLQNAKAKLILAAERKKIDKSQEQVVPGALFGKPGEIVVKRTHNAPWAQGRYFEREVADYLDAQFDKKSDTVLAWMQGYGNVVRSLTLGFDYAALLINGLPILSHSPQVWAQAMWRGASAVARPEAYDAFMAQDWVQELLRELTPHGLTLGGIEYMAGAQPGGLIHRAVGAIPRAGQAIQEQVLKRADLAFSGPLDIGKMLMARSLYPVYARQGRVADLATLLNNMTGTRSMEAVGYGPWQRSAESAAIFNAPRYVHSSIALIADALQGGQKAADARRGIAGLMVGWAILGFGLQWAFNFIQGLFAGDDDEDRGNSMPSFDFFDPDSSDFLRIEAFDARFSIGGMFFSIVRLLGRSVVAASRDPRVFLDPFDRQNNPLTSWYYNRTSPTTRVLWDVFGTGRDYIGTDLRDRANLPGYFARQTVPSWVQQVAMPYPGSERQSAVGSAAAFFGVNVDEPTPAMRRDQARDALARQRYGMTYDQLKDDERRAVEEDPNIKTLVKNAQAVYAARGSVLHQFRELVDQKQAPIIDKMRLAQQELDQGKIKGKAYRSLISDYERDLALIRPGLKELPQFKDVPVTDAEWAEWMKKNTGEALRPETQVDRFLNDWYGTADQIKSPSGFVDPVKLDAARQAVQQKYPPEVVKAGLALTNRYRSPEYKRALEAIRNYYNMPAWDTSKVQDGNWDEWNFLQQMKDLAAKFPVGSSEREQLQDNAEYKRLNKKYGSGGNPVRKQMWASSPLLQKYFGE